MHTVFHNCQKRDNSRNYKIKCFIIRENKGLFRAVLIICVFLLFDNGMYIVYAEVRSHHNAFNGK